MDNQYSKGLHILATLFSADTDALTYGESFLRRLQEEIAVLGLHDLHAHLHHFENGGYTGVICLTESHIAFHTWPENQLLTLDIYLSNFKMDNSEKARNLMRFCVGFFNATKVVQQEVYR